MVLYLKNEVYYQFSLLVKKNSDSIKSNSILDHQSLLFLTLM